jgi:hypothetical protein
MLVPRYLINKIKIFITILNEKVIVDFKESYISQEEEYKPLNYK